MMTLMFTHSPSIDICEISHLGCIQLNLTQLASRRRISRGTNLIGTYRTDVSDSWNNIFVGFFIPIAVVPQNLSSGSTLQCVCITCCFMLVESWVEVAGSGHDWSCIYRRVHKIDQRLSSHSPGGATDTQRGCVDDCPALGRPHDSHWDSRTQSQRQLQRTTARRKLCLQMVQRQAWHHWYDVVTFHKDGDSTQMM